MKVSVEIKGMAAIKARLDGMSKQVAFAASKALNATGKLVADAMPDELERALDKPTPFTKKGVRVLKYANKGNLETTVGFMAAQSKYMKWAIEGGTRSPGAAGLKLPRAIKINEFGNIPKGIIASLIAVANNDRKLGKVKARRIAVSNKVEIFYGDPTDHNGKVYPRGIYKRVSQGGKNQLIPLIVFPVVAAQYKKRFDFQAKAKAIIDREWQKQFDAAMADALRTAK